MWIVMVPISFRFTLKLVDTGGLPAEEHRLQCVVSTFALYELKLTTALQLLQQINT